MATYKTAPRVDYDLFFQGVAERLFNLATNRLVHGVPVVEKGSYSFRPTNRSQEPVVKILIFQRALGIQMQDELPWRDDGVYVLVRTNGEFGDVVWPRPACDGFQIPGQDESRRERGYGSKLRRTLRVFSRNGW